MSDTETSDAKNKQAVRSALRPALRPIEYDLFLHSIGDSKTYLEFGCGGSTRAAVEAEVPRIYSVESDRDWIMRCRRDPVLAKALREQRLTMHFARIGPVARFGRPSGREFMYAWPRYYLGVWDVIDGQLPDTVFVDGRFRVACAFQTLLRCPPETRILFHDFAERLYYHAVLEHAEVVEEAARLAVLRRRPGASAADIAISSYRFLLDAR